SLFVPIRLRWHGLFRLREGVMAVGATHVITTRILLVAGRGEATSLCTRSAGVALRVALGERAAGKTRTQQKRDPCKCTHSDTHGVAAAAALRVNLTFMGSLERAIANTGLFLPVVQLPV